MRWLLVLLFAFWSLPARADDVIVLQPLRFGSWIIPGNSAVYSVTVQPDGSYSNSPQLIMISPPSEGIFDIGALPANATINSLDVNQNTPLELGGQNFDMAGFQTSLSSGVTDNNGRVTVTVGATASTTGTGGGYPSGLYTGALDLNFDMNF